MIDNYGEIEDISPGKRVEFHPSMDIWMRGCRYGEVTSVRKVGTEIHVYVKPDCTNGKVSSKFRVKTTVQNLREV